MPSKFKEFAMVPSYLHRFFIGLLPFISASPLLASGGGTIQIQIEGIEQTILKLNGAPDAPSTNYVFSFSNQRIPTIIVSPSEISYRYDFLRDCVSDVYLINHQTIPMDDEDDEPDLNAGVNISSNIHFEYDESNRIRRISNREGAFILFFCEDEGKISKVIYNDGTVLFDHLSIFGTQNYPSGFDQEEKLDCIKLILEGNNKPVFSYYEILYYRNAQNQWKFGYRRQSSLFPFNKLIELSKYNF